ncbi:MAG: hypothetical protein ACKPJD_34355, partial [Planctomycetaceae bacterium]
FVLRASCFVLRARNRKAISEGTFFDYEHEHHFIEHEHVKRDKLKAGFRGGGEVAPLPASIHSTAQMKAGATSDRESLLLS